MPLSPIARTRLAKVAADNGFDLDRGDAAGWLTYESSQAPLGIWLTALEAGGFLLAVSRADVGGALANEASSANEDLPDGAACARRVDDLSALHGLARRAFQLARALPEEPLRIFVARTAALPRSTEVERLVIQRVGQEVFRDSLLDYWAGRCAVTGLDVPELLSASHIKPWADCEADEERLDVFNGLLLAPNIDAAFDRGFLTVAADGRLQLAESLKADARTQLGLDPPPCVDGLADGHRRYLVWHRRHVFRHAGR